MKKISSEHAMGCFTIFFVIWLILFCAVTCGKAQPTYERATERDSMLLCIEQFDHVFSLDDTILEGDTGDEAYWAFYTYVHKDTVNIDVARELFGELAKELEFVVHLQTDYNHDAQLYDGYWHEFLKAYIKK